MTVAAPTSTGRPLAPLVRGLWWQLPVAVAVGGAAGYLVGAGAWYLAIGLLVVPFGFVWLHRDPLVVLPIWLLVAPLVSVTDQVSIRMLYWVVHRLLPVAVLLLLLVRPLVSDRVRPLARPGWAELLLAGYVAVSLASIALTSNDVPTTTILFYDRVIAPMALYLVIRLLGPAPSSWLPRLMPVVVFVLITQSAIGVLSWIAPDPLPSAWINQLEARTTGSLRSVSVYGVTIVLCGLFMLDRAATARSRRARNGALLLFGLAALMVFMTFSRGSWLAGGVAFGGALILLYRRLVGRAALVLGTVLAILVGSGALGGYLEFAQQRLVSEQAQDSALSRLPVAIAGLRMFQDRPLFGFGYENFDRFDRTYQGPVAGFYPEKDHASHNLYVTLLAEQGIVGAVLFLGPAGYWLIRSVRARRAGLERRQLRMAVMLWLALLAHVVVNNFSNMRVTFGLGLWWITLALIATIVAPFPRRSASSPGAIGHGRPA